MAAHGDFLAIELEGLVERPVRLLVELRDRELDALAIALLEAREDRERRIDVAAADHVVEAQLVLLELRDVGGEQAGVLAVDALEVARVDRWPTAGRRAWTAAVVHAFEHRADASGHGTVALAWNHGAGRQLGIRGRLGGAGEHAGGRPASRERASGSSG